jgi:hypothetical protein
LILVGALALVAVAATVTYVSATEGEGEESAEPQAVAEPTGARDESRWTQAGSESAAKGKMGRHHTASPVIFGDQSIPLRFSHALHLDGDEMACLDCHDMVEDSMRSTDSNLPLEETCFECHDPNEAMEDPEAADPKASCDTCHPGYVPEFPDGMDDYEETRKATRYPAAIVLPNPNLKFNHKVHLDKGVECSTCHGDLKSTDFATRENALPIMGTCLSCHNGEDAPAECATCHLTLPDGRIDVKAGGGEPLVPAGWYHADSHDEGWLQNHRAAAQMGDGYCANCHAPKECVDCHNGVRKPLKFHPNNWQLTHPIAARKNNPDCASCHRSQTFCVGCHQQLKVFDFRDKDRSGLKPSASGIRFHPEGWATGTLAASGPNHHSLHAQRNIRQCASCHTEQTCLSCHSSRLLTGGAVGVSPHPMGFGKSAACKKMRTRNSRVCTKCHKTVPVCL